MKLATALRKASREDGPVKIKGISVQANGGSIHVDMTVRKIAELEQLRGLLLVTFETADSGTPAPSPKKEKSSKRRKGETSELETLKRELRYTKESLQSTIEELETTNEELKSTNEELQSANEELQISNEEIETSREEMQALNEELQTTNAELQIKVDDLSQSHDDMTNLLNSTDIGTIFLDNDLKIKRFTTQAKKLVNLIPADVGRPISDIVSTLKYQDLVKDSRQVLKTLVFKEVEVQTNDEYWYLMRIMPYRTADNAIDGLVITFIDINKLKKTEAKLRDYEDSNLLAAVLRNSSDVITVQTFDGQIKAWNRGAELMYGYSRAEALKMNIRDMIPEGHREEAENIARKIANKENVKSFMTKRLCKKGRTLEVCLAITLLYDESGKPSSFATIERRCPDNVLFAKGSSAPRKIS
ncbi:MAG: PAS domain-containing protein [Nitrospinales bacterium]